MPQNAPHIAPLIFQKMTMGFQEIDYSIYAQNVYELQDTLQALQKEASMKGLVVVLMVALDEWPLEDQGETEVALESEEPNYDEPTG